MTQLTDVPTQILDSNGKPIVAAKRWWFETATTTKKSIYSDAELTTPVTNPQISDSEGRYDSVYGDGVYKVLQESNDGTSDTVPNGTEIWTQDPTNQSPTSQFSDYDSTRTYSIGDIVFSDPYYYISITDSNSGNNPSSSAANWSRLPQVVVWNINETYSQYDAVYGSDGNIYTSKQDSNVGNDPTTDTANTWWEPGIKVENIDVSRLDIATLEPLIDAANLDLDNFKATKAQQEAGTSTDVYVSPGTQIYNYSSVKKYCNIDGTGTVAYREDLGFGGITDNGTGDYSLTFDGNMSNDNFSAVFGGYYASGNISISVRPGSPQSVSQIRIACEDLGGTRQDPDVISIQICGRLA